MKKLLAAFVLLMVWALLPAAGTSDSYAGNGLPEDEVVLPPPGEQGIVIDSDEEEESGDDGDAYELIGGSKETNGPGGVDDDDDGVQTMRETIGDLLRYYLLSLRLG